MARGAHYVRHMSTTTRYPLSTPLDQPSPADLAWLRRLVVALALAVGACGADPTPAPVRDVVARCTSASGVRVELVRGVEAGCAGVASLVDSYRALYEGRWGPVPLETVRAFRGVPIEGHSGVTWGDGTVDFDLAASDVLPHEFHHVAGHAGHAGWCDPFAVWECQVLGAAYCDAERAYLGCTTNP